jgi:outer membrane protein TolC
MPCWRSAFVFLLAVVPLSAQEPMPSHDLPTGDDPIVASLLAEALERNPEVRAAAAQVREAEAGPDLAAALPEPSLSVLYTNEGWSPTLGSNPFTTLGFLLSQDLPGKGKRGLRREMAQGDALLAAEQLARVRLAVAGSVRRAYHELIHARELLDLLREQEVLYEAVAGAARERYGVGQGTQADVLRAQAERLRLLQMRAERTAEEAVQLAELNRLRARPHDTAVATASHPAPMPVARVSEELLAAAEAASPELRAAQAAVERERASLAFAHRGGQVDWSVQAGYQNRGGLPGMWQAGFGVRLPVWRGKVEAAIVEADARLRAREERLAAVRLLLRLRTEERLLRARSVEEAAELYAKGLIPQGRLAYEAALAAYETGRGSFVAVLEAASLLYRDREAELRLLADHQILVAALAEASLEPTVTMGARAR